MRILRLLPRPVVVTLALVVVLLLVGDVVPRTTLFLSRALPNDASFTTTTAAEDAQLLNCTNAGCTPTTRPLVMERLTTTGPAEDQEQKRKAITASTTTTLRTADDGTVLAVLGNSAQLTRRSGYPTAESDGTSTLEVPSVDLDVATEPATREGLEPFFPHTTERRSYQFF